MAKMTREGYNQLKQELEKLENEDRPRIAKILKDAIAQGDLSENFAYQDGKERQTNVEARIAVIKDELKNAEIEEKTSSGIVQLGSKIVVKSEDGLEKIFTITGREEINPMQGKISYDSPLGEAFLDCAPGDTVEVTTPSGIKTYTILSIT
ncbi:MAG: transcription elongation factor GreA [Candidatus Spechtbacteria bacterium SB0662_bin_43]|uniref:Transcription elongation factor GreA n=1 Tax=Candidatus Spechtbacteria bacterium SB0662_bin_43 TaxID=2604897 RepID=A0A845D8E6_9BACT|nr:transcription elongation factor GreA [Candidatus Spechtbacteria bacterium SB0662_bin_43]